MRQGEHVHDRYVLGSRIGSGGMAEVWQAHDLRLQRDVAIKFLAPQLAQDPEFMVRFFAEAQGVARISHPNVIQVLDFGEFNESSFLVMELATGGSVKDLTGEPVAQERAATIVGDAAQGAGAAHEIGIVHRDIKPGNILLNEEGAAKLADFGIASIIAAEKLTGTGLAIGSPHYISPEQASGKDATPRSDVYSLGVVLYELLTGNRPFDASNMTALAIAHVEQTPPPPSRSMPEIEPTLEAVVLRCLEKDPEMRYPDGVALADALTGSVAGPVAAPVPAPEPEETAAIAVTAEPAVAEPRSRVPWFAAAALLLIGGIAMAFWLTSGHNSNAHVPAISKVSPSVTPTHKRHHRKPSPSTSVLSSTEGSAIAPASATPSAAPTHTASPRPHHSRSPKPKPSAQHTSPKPSSHATPSSSPS